ncbi:MAG TPA: hypothetical protein VNH84_10825, partial [Candidatus Saccharimonadales bacterium]|nr:hypothetical protein [Candidatus Saccharimonadales bacterium]
MTPFRLTSSPAGPMTARAGRHSCRQGFRQTTRPAGRTIWTACLLVLAALVPSGFGQQGLENMLFSAGTVTRDAGARDWAYLLWQSSTPALVQGKSFAIYAKPGAANAAGSYTRKAVVTLHTDPLVIAPLLNRAANLGD